MNRYYFAGIAPRKGRTHPRTGIFVSNIEHTISHWLA